MKKSLKYLSGLAAAAIVSSANAAPINVGGVVWDPDSIFDFSAVDSMIENVVQNVGDELRGFARITTLNNTAEAVFCPGCELTYVFDGFILEDNAAGLGNSFVFSGGSIRVYVDNTPDYDGFNRSTAENGNLWLELAGALFYDPVVGEVGTIISDATPASTGVAGDGRGFMNVVGGLAAAFFDPEAFPIDSTGDGIADSFAAFQFTSSFQLIPGGGFISDDGVFYGLFGSNEIQARTVLPVPEPGVLSLLALALIVGGVVSRGTRVLRSKGVEFKMA